MKKKLRMVGYGRVSTDEEKQLDSLKHQIAFFSEFADQHNYQLMRVYADEGISGKQLKKRDQFLKMIKDAGLDLFDVVVVKDVSRFARNTVDLLTCVRKLKGMGVNVLFVNNNQQTLGESEFVITLLGAMAQEESANLSKRVKFGKDITAKRGRVPRLILGYDKIDNYTLMINPQEASLVYRIYDMYLSGVGGMARIAATLRREKIKTKLGCDYTEGYIRRILTNPIYYGELVNHKTETIDFIEGIIQAIPEEQQYRHSRPELAIVTKEMFDMVQQIRLERHNMQNRNGKEPKRRHTNRHLFSGLVRCAHCDHTMFLQRNTRKNGAVDSYWRCPLACTKGQEARCDNNTYLRDDILSQGVSEMLRECIGDRNDFVKMLQNELQNYGDPENEMEKMIEKLEKEVEKHDRHKEKYLDLYANEIITIEELKKKIRKDSEQEEDKIKQLSALKKRRERTQTAAQREDLCLQEVERFLNLENAVNQDVRRIISQINVWKDHRIEVVFKIPEQECLPQNHTVDKVL